MEIFKNLYISFLNFRKKRYIRKELEKKFKEFRVYDKNRLDVLTEAIFKSAKIVKNNAIELKIAEEKHSEEQLFNDLKNVISKHYEDKSKDLEKKVILLETNIKNKIRENKELKNKIAKVVNN